MTSTVIDVTVLLLCVSASVVALGGAGEIGNASTVRGATPDEVADRLTTETVTVRYQTPEAAAETRTVHATRAELIALLVAGGDASRSKAGVGRSRTEPNERAFESRVRAVIAAGIGERTRIDATVRTGTERDDASEKTTHEHRVGPHRHGRRATAAVATMGPPYAPRFAGRDGSQERRGGTQNAAGTERRESVTIGPEPPRSADVATAVVTHPVPGEIETTASVRIVVRRW